MSQMYLRELVAFAQKEIPDLSSDLQNASTLYALQATTQRLFNLTTYMLHHIIHAAYESGSGPVAPPAPPAPVVAPSPPAPVFASTSGMPQLPPPTTITQPVPGPSVIPGMPEVSIQPGVTNVVITAQGTQVIAPSGATSRVAPGEAVGLEATMGRPPEPFVEPGVATVVLPPGGGMSPDVLAALASRSGQSPT
jgi:hypothetical protein